MARGCLSAGVAGADTSPLLTAMFPHTCWDVIFHVALYLSVADICRLSRCRRAFLRLRDRLHRQYFPGPYLEAVPWPVVTSWLYANPNKASACCPSVRLANLFSLGQGFSMNDFEELAVRVYDEEPPSYAALQDDLSVSPNMLFQLLGIHKRPAMAFPPEVHLHSVDFDRVHAVVWGVQCVSGALRTAGEWWIYYVAGMENPCECRSDVIRLFLGSVPYFYDVSGFAIGGFLPSCEASWPSFFSPSLGRRVQD